MYHPSNGSPRTDNTWGYFAVHEKHEANTAATASHGELPLLPSRERKKAINSKRGKNGRRQDTRNVAIPVVDDIRFLGGIFDRKLTFLPHILHLRKKCERSLTILKAPSKTSWGADRTSLLRIYQAVVLSRIDYGCMVCGSARATVLRRLDTIHHSAFKDLLWSIPYLSSGEPLAQAKESKEDKRARILAAKRDQTSLGDGSLSREDFLKYSFKTNKIGDDYDSDSLLKVHPSEDAMSTSEVDEPPLSS
ncbi:hypothetical protein AVEN_54772-1 [Araneus ventricosus]|uniref:Uncharacterized protein n=1 Tax=Araneus ventricosus TaxID=182803 RepID=A0A4Y2IYM5_ARAVE|nr:hypothetical protein AVEN_54772-1 [Araneus ventricosus]